MSRLKKPEVKAKKKFAKKPEPKKVTTADGWSPPPIADKAMNQPMAVVTEKLSASMRELMYPAQERKIMVVMSRNGGVTNRDQFVKDMGLLNYSVVFLEYEANVGNMHLCPTISEFTQK